MVTVRVFPVVAVTSAGVSSKVDRATSSSPVDDPIPNGSGEGEFTVKLTGELTGEGEFAYETGE